MATNLESIKSQIFFVMFLTIRQASDTLGKSQRQIRYLIQQGELEAEKKEGRWRIDSRSLPLSEGQRAALQRRETRLAPIHPDFPRW